MKPFLLLLCFFSSFTAYSQLYFPPLQGDQWETVSPQSLGWNTAKIPALYDFLEAENSKALLVLKDGRIVLEKYFGTFTQDSAWYWASTGKTITAFLVGKAQDENLSLFFCLVPHCGLFSVFLPCKMEQNSVLAVHSVWRK